MPYGTIKVDNITFTNGGSDTTITVSGLAASTTGNLTVTGTISGAVVRATTVSGVTVTGTTVQGASGTFTSITGGVATITSGVFAAGSAAAPSISFTSDANTGIYSPGADQVAISTDGVGRLFVDANGCVGVGATPDNQAYRLQIYNASQDAAYLSIGNNVSGSGALNGLVVGQNQSDSLFINRENGSQQFYTNGSERLRITSAGLVGVGTSSPSTALHAFSTGTEWLGQFGNITANGSNVRIRYNAIGAFAANSVASNLLLNPDGGNVGIGASSPSKELQINATTPTIRLEENSASAKRLELSVNSSGEASIFATQSATQLLFGTVGTERARIDSSGRLLVGTSTAETWFGSLVQIQSSGSEASFTAIRNQNSTSGSYIFLGKSRGTTANSATIVQSGDELGGINFLGADGSTNRAIAASIYAFVDGTPGTNDMPGRLVFSTTADGTNSPTERMRITNAGNVGIGTTAPSARLQVGAGSADGVNLDFNGTIATGSEYSTLKFTASAYGFTGAEIRGIHTNGGTNLGVLGFHTAGSERARIDSSGRLLVGTSTARANFYNGTDTGIFQVEGANDITKRFSSFIYGRDNADGPLLLLGKHRGTSVGGTTVVASGDEIGRITFQGSDGTQFVAGAEIQAYVDATPGADDMPGRLVFSTTADGASSPTERMRITNTGATNVFASTANVLGAGSNQAAGTTYYLFYGANNASNTTTGTTCFLVFTNGNVQNTNNSYAGISDAKLKENIVDATSQWSDIKALQVRKYNFKEGQTHTQIGLIAQEVELVSPGLVTESPDRDAEGNNLGTVTKSVNYSVLYMKAVKALQEAMERIETLEAKVAALEGA